MKANKFEAGMIFQATLGTSNMGLFTSEEEAVAEIKDFNPKAVPIEETPKDPTKLPEGKYFVMPRTVYTTDQARANILKGQLGKIIRIIDLAKH